MDRIKKPLAGLLALLLALVLAACGSQKTGGAPITLVITSAGVSASGEYRLTGVATSTDQGDLEVAYSVNESDWQALELGPDGTFDATIALQHGSNLITAAASGSGGQRAERTVTVTVDSSGGPQVAITSAAYSESADYVLTGFAFDDAAVTGLSYSLGGAEPLEIELAKGGSFEVGLVLAPGTNDIVVTARDADGNSATAETTVTYAPQIGEVTVSPMIAESGHNVTISGSGFGSTAGSVSFGASGAKIVSWSDSEVVVTVPNVRPGGWTSLTLDSGFSEFEVEDFFIGLEVTEPDLNLLLAGEQPPAGTALLLSGNSYTTNQTTDEADQFLPTYSFFGVRTDDEPVTTITGVGSRLLFGVSGVFPVQFQDLNLHASAGMTFADTDELTTTALNPIDSQLVLQNVRMVGPGDDTSVSRIAIGTPGAAPVLGPTPDMMADYVLINGSTISGFNEIVVTGKALEVNDSSLAAPGIALHAGHAALTIRSSALESAVLMIVNGVKAAQIVETELYCGGYCIFGDLLGSDPQNSLRLEDSQVSSEGSGIFAVISGDDSVVRGNSFTLNIFLMNPESGHVVVEDNDFTLGEELDFTINVRADLHFVNNGNVATPSFSITGGTSVVENNSFDLSSAPDDKWPLVFTSGIGAGEDPAPTSISFLNNSTTGSAMLFDLLSEDGKILNAEINGNDFDAELTAAGSVARVTDLVAPSLVTASGNIWGTITDLDEVRALVTYDGSDASVFTITE